MSTIQLDSAEPRTAGRTVPLLAAIAVVAVTGAGAFAGGYQLAPTAAPAQAVPGVGAAAGSHTAAAAAEEARALKRRAAALSGTKIVTAGGWTGAVYEDTGIPVAAGIPQEFAGR